MTTLLGGLLLQRQGGFGGQRQPPVPAPSGVALPAAPPAVSAVSASAPAPLARMLPSALPAPPPSASAVDVPAARPDRQSDAALDADWCARGAAAHERESEAVVAGATDARGVVKPDIADHLDRTESAKLLKRATAEAESRWVDELRRRDDPRSLAVADFLLAGSTEAEATAQQAAARLQAGARSSTDPMLTALALQRRCGPGVCRNIEPEQWSRLEPANLQAWLPVTPGQWRVESPKADYVLERISSEARYSRSYRHETLQLLLSLAQTERPGLRSQVELNRLVGVEASWGFGNLRDVIQVCRREPVVAGVAARCEAVAALLWAQGEQLEQALSMSIARLALRSLPERRSIWEVRALEYEALGQWVSDAHSARIDALIKTLEASPCEGLTLLRAQFAERLRAGDVWALGREKMRGTTVDAAALAARWRESNGRAALDPPRQR